MTRRVRSLVPGAARRGPYDTARQFGLAKQNRFTKTPSSKGRLSNSWKYEI